MMIPKIIHYCWFGQNKKGKVIEKCIESWKRYCPDYEIIEWNESNFDVNCCKYTAEAYRLGKYAFVSDYVRQAVLFENGGIYLDTDVELLKPLDDLLEVSFCGFEKSGSVNTGLIFGAEKGHWLCRAMLDSYGSTSFLDADGKPDLTTVCNRTTAILIDKGLAPENKTQRLEDLTVYDSSYFNPYDMNTGKIEIKDNTYSIHRYAGSWVSKSDKIRGNVYRVAARCFGVSFADKLRKLFGRKGERK